MWSDILLWIFLGVNTITDIKTRKINIILCLLFGVFGMVVFAGSSEKDFLSLGGGIMTGVYMLVFSLLTREAVGLGDGFVVTATGIWLGGGKTLLVLMGGFLFAALFGVIKICAGKANGKSELAFVPFFSMSYVICYVGGLL